MAQEFFSQFQAPQSVLPQRRFPLPQPAAPPGVAPPQAAPAVAPPQVAPAAVAAPAQLAPVAPQPIQAQATPAPPPAAPQFTNELQQVAEGFNVGAGPSGFTPPPGFFAREPVQLGNELLGRVNGLPQGPGGIIGPGGVGATPNDLGTLLSAEAGQDPRVVGGAPSGRSGVGRLDDFAQSGGLGGVIDTASAPASAAPTPLVEAPAPVEDSGPVRSGRPRRPKRGPRASQAEKALASPEAAAAPSRKGKGLGRKRVQKLKTRREGTERGSVERKEINEKIRGNRARRQRRSGR